MNVFKILAPFVSGFAIGLIYSYLKFYYNHSFKSSNELPEVDSMGDLLSEQECKMASVS